ncbi:hypothetical protein EBR96_08095, partial [bacterium]|nr:hypothetical protein [bacterium]
MANAFIWRRLGGVLLVAALAAPFAGCGAASNSSEGGDYSGSAVITGTVLASSTDLTSVGESAGASSLSVASLRAKWVQLGIDPRILPKTDDGIEAVNEATAYLYEITPSGLINTGKTAPVVNGNYNF